ncbi:MAG: hypothetical protein AB9873_10190 [Syntrophobacteraceae bacterium]
MSLGRLKRLTPILVLIFLSAWTFPSQTRADVHNPAPVSWTHPEDDDPFFENQLETEHFILKWTAKSRHPRDNIRDPEIVRETAGYLETAWDKLTGLFGRKPYLPPGSSKIGVVFKDLEYFAYADPPEGPIELNAFVWQKMPSIRQATSAHELFHKLQYAYGYKTRWSPGEPMLWFSEGTAAWAEVFVWGRVSRDCKMEDMFRDTSLDLYEAEDMALPFWIFLVSGNRNSPKDEIMVDLFRKYEETGDANEALFSVIQEGYGSVDRFLQRFALERKSNFWQERALEGCPYPSVLGPDGKDLVAKIKDCQGKMRGMVPHCR